MRSFFDASGSRPIVLPRALLDLWPELPSMRKVALLAITPVELASLRELAGNPERQALVGFSVFNPGGDLPHISIMGPAMGAPIAAMAVELQAALGAERVIALGSCGALQPTLSIGDIVLAETAIREEGTSYHYAPPEETATADPAMIEALADGCRRAGAPFQRGTVWTSDALFRETRAKVDGYRAQGVLAVDMETAALLVVARHSGLRLGVLLVVSDQLAEDWHPGFTLPSFRSGHLQACRIALDTARANPSRG